MNEAVEIDITACDVTIGLMNGDTLKGELAHFSPLLRYLALIPFGKVNAKQVDIFDIVYVGFHRLGGGSSRPMKLAGMERLKVHTVTSECFDVLEPSNQFHPAGFYAMVDDTGQPFESMFFYHHGVRSKKKAQPLGEIITQAPVAPPEAVQQELAEQEVARKEKLGDILVEQKKISIRDVEASSEQRFRKRKRLGEMLIEAGLIKQEDLNKALKEQAQCRGKKLGETLVEMKIISEQDMMSCLAMKCQMAFVDLDECPVDPAAVGEIDAELIQKHQWLPIGVEGDNLLVAIPDPLAMDAFDAVHFQTRKYVIELLAAPSQLRRHIDHLLGSHEKADTCWTEQAGLAMEGKSEEGGENEVQMLKAAGAPPVVQLVNKIILGGLRKDASDIHLLPQAKRLLVAYRINGELREETSLEQWVQRRVIARVKIMCGMDISEHRLPQDGRLVVHHEKKTVEFRISCMPGSHGESLVLRVLNKENAVDVTSLGMREEDSKRLTLLTHKPFGLILVTGPTGSGKSTTLFAVLKALTELPLHIITVEDPIESDIAGTNQIQVHAKIGLTFARVLRNVLRHDPDVIMVGEMRDEETAKIGIESALTGHLMLSTLHTNTAVDTIVRLTDLDVPTYLLAPALLAVISQSLVKRLCEKCRKPVAKDDEVFTLLKDMGHAKPNKIFKAGVCDQCNQTGYTGRVMVYEFMDVSDELRQAIHDGLVGQELQAVAEKGGMIPKAKHALELAGLGIIGRDDLIRMLI
ncbi:MAG: GspE/PulE family protein [Mariprofundaceae bacterium]